MKAYLKTWGIILLVVNILVFGYLTGTDGSIIKCNKTYNKVYPCNTVNVVTARIDMEIDETPSSWKSDYVRREPSLARAGRLSSDLKYIGEIHLIINIVLVVTALFLYVILSNVEVRRFGIGSFASIALAAFLIGAGYVSYQYYKSISQPGKIVGEIHYNAPIIYLYDDLEREATVKLDLNGELTCTYPRYNEETGWVVKTSSDGVLTDKSGRQYEYLYWEADIDMEPDLSRGFCVKGEDSVEFLEKALSDLGLSDTEANAFIMYWLPQLEENPYNVITFQGETYENVAKLNVDPLPDTVVRVNMLFYGCDEYVEIEEQDLSSMNPSVSEREGFVLVEWGGGKLV